MLTNFEEHEEDESVGTCLLYTVNDCFLMLLSLSETSLDCFRVTSLSTVDGATVDSPVIQISDNVSVLSLSTSDGLDN